MHSLSCILNLNNFRTVHVDPAEKIVRLILDESGAMSVKTPTARIWTMVMMNMVIISMDIFLIKHVIIMDSKSI